MVLEWDGQEWRATGNEAPIAISDADVLAGPLQAPRIGPGEDVALFEAAEDIEPGDLVSLDLSGNKIRKTPLVPIVPPLDANVAREASIAAYWRRRHAIVDGTLERLDAEFVAATTRPDGTVDYEASRPVNADLSGWAGPLVSGETNRERARQAWLATGEFQARSTDTPPAQAASDTDVWQQFAHNSMRNLEDLLRVSGANTVALLEHRATAKAIRLRARALLEGTTPGPWTWDDDGVCGPRYEMVARTLVCSDGAFIAAAHALLTELAKEGE
jgi:hypothetical protein